MNNSLHLVPQTIREEIERVPYDCPLTFIFCRGELFTQVPLEGTTLDELLSSY